MVAVTPVITTARPEPLPFAIVTVVPLGAKLVEAAETDTIVPPVAGLFISGLDVGKLVSFAIGTKPPTSSTRSIILSLIAAVVAIVVSLSGNVSPFLIVSPELMLKYLASDAEVVKKDVSFTLADACSLLVTITESAILAAVTASSAICSVLTARSASLSSLTASLANLPLVTLRSVILSVVTALLSILLVVTLLLANLASVTWLAPMCAVSIDPSV